MKKLVISILLILTTLFTFGLKTYALDLPYNEDFTEEYQIYGNTYELEFYVNINKETTGFAYNENILEYVETNNTLKFLVISNTETNVILYNKADKSVVKVLDLTFVNPEVVEVAKSNEDFYYVKANNKPLYGDFTWVVDGKEMKANQVKGKDVILKYNNLEIIHNQGDQKSLLEQYIILILGLPIFIFVVGYLIYIMVPSNIYKKIYKASVKIKKSINRPNLDYKKILFKLKLKLPVLSNLISMVDETDPKIKAYRKVNSDLNKMLDNLINLEDFFPEENIEGILKYVNRKLDVYITITENGTYKYKKDIKNIVTKPVLSKPDMDRNQNDSFRYLESIKVIDRNKDEEKK